MRYFNQTIRSFILLVVAMLPLLALSAQTLDGKSEYKGVKYITDPSSMTASVASNGDNTITVVDIPATVTDLNGKTFTVVAISSKAFYDCANLRELTIGPNVKTIGSNAFYGCNKLESLIVPEGVEVIEEMAFANCLELRSIELPSTLRALTKNSFNNNASRNTLKSIRLATANYDAESDSYRGLPFLEGAFNKGTINDPECTLYVPKKAEAWYRSTYGRNWGYYFKGERIQTYGTAPIAYSVTPVAPIADYRSLEHVAINFAFEDATLTNNVTFGDGDYISATLLVGGSVRIPADPNSITVANNAIHIDFTQMLAEYKQAFVAKSEEAGSVTVDLLLSGQIQIEECPFDLGDYFGTRRIAWSVPLLPSVFELPTLPVVTLSGQADADGYYTYDAFQTVTLTFPGYKDVSLDTATGAYMNAVLSVDGKEFDTVTTAAKAQGNTIVLPFSVSRDDILVRKNTGIESFVFSMNITAQVRLSDGKNYRFTMTPSTRVVRAEYLPEPTSISPVPAEGVVELDDLMQVELKFEGIKSFEILKGDGALPFTAQLRLDDIDLINIDTSLARVEGNSLFLQVDTPSAGFITLISENKDIFYDFSVALSADILADGYPCRVLVGNPTQATMPEGTNVNNLYTVDLPAPKWQVRAIVKDMPKITVSTPLAGPNGPSAWEDLKVVVLNVENYKEVSTVPTFDGMNSNAKVVASLLRYGNPVSVVNYVTTEGNQIIIDFSNTLSYSAVSITPDDDPNEPIELTLHFEGDLVFDGLPARLVVDGYKDGFVWRIQPVVVYKLPTPTIEYADNRIYFNSGVEGVQYHYTINNVDTVSETKVVATKGANGSCISIPLRRRYEITVYATREGYDPSDVATSYLVLDSAPTVTTKK